MTSKAGRKATGTAVKTRDGRWQVMVTLADGTRKRVPGVYFKTKAAALKKAPFYAEQAQGLRRKAKPAVPAAATCDDGERWVEMWLAERRKRGLTSVRDNDAHWRIHIRDVLGNRHVRDWTPEGLRELVRVLDEKVLAGGLAWKTATNIWGTATKMTRDACRSKMEALRCRDEDPARGVEGPDRGQRKSKQVLYPSEAAALFACESVPVRYRRYIAIALYTGMRAGELRALRWGDVDFAHGIIHVHRAYSYRLKAEKPTKGMQNRKPPIEAAIRPLLEAMHREAGGVGYVATELATECELSTALRRYLRAAGVTREDLFAERETSQHITWHALRGTHATWCAVRGDDPIRIQVRLGHQNFSTTQGYLDLARTLEHGFGEPFPPIPTLKSAPKNARGRASSRNYASPAGFEPALLA